jgi:hypothetical protein
MFFYMRLEKHVCKAMSRGLWIHEYFEFMFVRWRVRATYATGNYHHQYAMSRGLLLPEYFDCLLVCWRVRATYATDTDNLQTKERFMHDTFESLHCELR